jgi:mono/diheme cytochrome c family protein
MNLLKLTIAFLLIAFFIGCIENRPKRGGIVIENSKSYEASIYRQNCAICHGKEANGKEIDGKFVPGLRYGEIEKRSEEEIYYQIKEGKMPMPSFKNQLTEKEIQLMVQFIRRDLQGKE